MSLKMSERISPANPDDGQSNSKYIPAGEPPSDGPQAIAKSSMSLEILKQAQTPEKFADELESMFEAEDVAEECSIATAQPEGRQESSQEISKRTNYGLSDEMGPDPEALLDLGQKLHKKAEPPNPNPRYSKQLEAGYGSSQPVSAHVIASLQQYSPATSASPYFVPSKSLGRPPEYFFHKWQELEAQGLYGRWRSKMHLEQARAALKQTSASKCHMSYAM